MACLICSSILPLNRLPLQLLFLFKTLYPCKAAEKANGRGIDFFVLLTASFYHHWCSSIKVKSAIPLFQSIKGRLLSSLAILLTPFLQGKLKAFDNYNRFYASATCERYQLLKTSRVMRLELGGMANRTREQSIWKQASN